MKVQPRPLQLEKIVSWLSTTFDVCAQGMVWNELPPGWQAARNCLLPFAVGWVVEKAPRRLCWEVFGLQVLTAGDTAAQKDEDARIRLLEQPARGARSAWISPVRASRGRRAMVQRKWVIA